MRHGKKFNHLGRQKGHRKALLKNLSIALITHKRINTTLAKAKALRVHLEPLITKSKNNTTHSRRVVFSYLQNKYAVQELFDVISEKIASRPGGYLRIIKTGFRKGDGAEMAMIEFVDFNDVFTNKASGGEEKGKKKRSRRGSKSKAAAATTTIEEEVEEEVSTKVVEEISTEEEISTDVAEEVIVEKEIENVGEEDPELTRLNEEGEGEDNTEA